VTKSKPTSHAGRIRLYTLVCCKKILEAGAKRNANVSPLLKKYALNNCVTTVSMCEKSEHAWIHTKLT
jgi:hypothetical protein